MIDRSLTTLTILGSLATLGCGGTNVGDDDARDAAGQDAPSTDLDTSPTTTDAPTSLDCTASDAASQGACAAQAFLDTLGADERDTVLYDLSDSVQKTCWSNLPGQARPGITLGALDAESRAAAMTLAQLVLSDAGYEDLRGVLAADDYLGSAGSGGGGMFSYTSDNAHVALFGTPGSGDWMLSFGNHHMAYNVTFVASVGHPTPNHLGAEPRGEFTVDGETFGPLVSEGDAMQALFASLDASTLGAAHLSGSFADVVLGPDEYCTGDASRVVFPTGTQRGGVLVSTLEASQQALVTAAIAEWVRDYAADIAEPLMSEYTSATAYGDTLIAWGGSGSAPDVTANGTYFRIDGPRVWIEVAVQNGVVLSGTHYHTIYRDRSFDYGGAL